jgi:hypothetical protein
MDRLDYTGYMNSERKRNSERPAVRVVEFLLRSMDGCHWFGPTGLENPKAREEKPAQKAFLQFFLKA